MGADAQLKEEYGGLKTKQIKKKGTKVAKTAVAEGEKAVKKVVKNVAKAAAPKVKELKKAVAKAAEPKVKELKKQAAKVQKKAEKQIAKAVDQGREVLKDTLNASAKGLAKAAKKL